MKLSNITGEENNNRRSKINFIFCSQIAVYFFLSFFALNCAAQQIIDVPEPCKITAVPDRAKSRDCASALKVNLYNAALNQDRLINTINYYVNQIGVIASNRAGFVVTYDCNTNFPAVDLNTALNFTCQLIRSSLAQNEAQSAMLHIQAYHRAIIAGISLKPPVEAENILTEVGGQLGSLNKSVSDLEDKTRATLSSIGLDYKPQEMSEIHTH